MKLNIIIYVLLAVISASAYAAPNQVVFLDDFESYTAGQVLPVRPAAFPQVGYGWSDFYAPSNDLVVDTIANSGTKSLKLMRDTSTNRSHVLALSTTTGAMANGQDTLIQQDVYLPTGGGCENYYIVPSKAGWSYSGGRIMVLNNGTPVDSGIYPSIGAWDTYYAVLHLIDKGGTPKVWAGTYDLYISKANGTFITLGKGMTIADSASGDTIARLHLYATYNSSVYYDNIKMIGNYVAVCGDIVHPIPEGDLNSDCKVNFADFAKLAVNWMVCTPIACQ